MQEVTFTVPYLTPQSGNHYKRPCKYIGRDGGLHLGFKLTKQAKAYYEAVAIFARGASVTPATEAEQKRARYIVTLHVWLGAKQRGDADNFLKCGIDGLVSAGVIHSDANVYRCEAFVHKEDRDNPRTLYIVSRLEN